MPFAGNLSLRRICPRQRSLSSNCCPHRMQVREWRITTRPQVRGFSPPTSLMCASTVSSRMLHVFGRYTYFGGALSGNPFFGAAGGLGFGSGGFAGSDNFHYSSLASGGDYVLSSKWLTDFRFGYYRIYNNTVGPNGNQPLGNELEFQRQRGQSVAGWRTSAIQYRYSG